ATPAVALAVDVFVDANGVKEARFAALVHGEPRLGRHVLPANTHDRVLERADAPVVCASALEDLDARPWSLASPWGAERLVVSAERVAVALLGVATAGGVAEDGAILEAGHDRGDVAAREGVELRRDLLRNGDLVVLREEGGKGGGGAPCGVGG